MTKRTRGDERDEDGEGLQCLILPFNCHWTLFPRKSIEWEAPERAFPGLCFFFEVSLHHHANSIEMKMRTMFPLQNRGRAGERCPRHGPFGCHCIAADNLGQLAASLVVECNGRFHPIEEAVSVGQQTSLAFSILIEENGDVDLLLTSSNAISFPFPSQTKVGPFFRLRGIDTLEGVLSAFSRGWNSFGKPELESFGPMPACGVCRKVTYLPQKCTNCFRKLCNKCSATCCDKCRNVCCAVCVVHKSSCELEEDCCPMCVE